MSRRLPLAGVLLIAGFAPTTVLAQDAVYRQGQPGMAGEAPERPGQPVTLDAPYQPSGGDMTYARFGAAYARARAPRVVVFWNRELTDDLETEREAVTSFSASSQGRASSRRTDYGTRRADHSDVEAEAESSTSGEVRSREYRIDPGKRATPFGEAEDFAVERGFVQALSGAGVRLVDRTAIMRASALQGGASNAQDVEMRALLGRAEWTLEVSPMHDEGAPDHVLYKIVVRDVARGTVVAMASSNARPAPRKMPYVAGPNGFVRATEPEPTGEMRGRELARAVMAAVADQGR